MSRLSEIQNEYAQENGAENWFKLISNIDETWDNSLDNYYHDTYMQYLKECCQASLEKAGGKVTMFKICDKCNTEFPLVNNVSSMQTCPYCGKSNHVWTKVNNQSITNPENIILL